MPAVTYDHCFLTDLGLPSGWTEDLHRRCTHGRPDGWWRRLLWSGSSVRCYCPCHDKETTNA